MSFELRSNEPRVYQVHDRVYFEQEVRITPSIVNLLKINPLALLATAKYLIKKSLEVNLHTTLNSLLLDGAELSRIEVFPSCFKAKIEKKKMVVSGSFSHKETSIIKIMMQFVLPSDKIFNFVDAEVLDKTDENQSSFFTFLVKNKRDWPIEYLKLYLHIETKNPPKKTELCEVNFDTREKRTIGSLTSNMTMSFTEKFRPLESKIHSLEVEFKGGNLDPDIQIEVSVNDSSLTKSEAIAFVPGSMLPALKKFYSLLRTLDADIWWFEEHLDKDCFDFLSEGVDKSKVKNIRVIGGPIHMNDKFKEHCNAFIRDMSTCGINVQVEAILDEKTLGFLHGRFLFDANKLYVVPSSNIISKKFDAVVPISDQGEANKIRAQVLKIWQNSTPVSNWKRIREKRDSLLPKSSL